MKKPKVEFPVYEEPSGGPGFSSYQSYDQTASIEDIEEQMNDWLDQKRSSKKKVWTSY